MNTAIRHATRAVFTQRLYSVQTDATPLRQRLTVAVKTAMKNKDSTSSTLLRSVLSEIYAADKLKGELPENSIVSLVRKAVARRNDAIAQYTQANRSDLAEQELREVEILNAFLPPLLSKAELESRLRAAIDETGLKDATEIKKSTNSIMKAFFAKTDRSEVDSKLIKPTLDAIISS